MRRWLILLLVVAIAIAATVLLEFYFVRSSRWRSAGAGMPMRMPLWFGMLGVVCGLLSFALAILSPIFPGIDSHGRPAEPSPWFLPELFGIAVLGALLCAVWVFDRVTIEPDRLVYRTVLGRGEVPWSEIARVGYSQRSAWFMVRTIGGRTARISEMMTGVPEFARMVLRQVPVERIDSGAHAILEAAAQVQ